MTARRPRSLKVGVWLSTDDQVATTVRYLADQPLLPQWRVRVVVDQPVVVDAAVVDRLTLASALWMTRRVVVVAEPGELAVACNGRVVQSVVLADDPPAHLGRALAAVAAGGVWISARAEPALAAALGVTGGEPVPDLPLTPTERQTLEMLLSGHSNEEIAARRRVSINTVRSCVRYILRKYACVSRQQLVARFLRSRGH